MIRIDIAIEIYNWRISVLQKTDNDDIIIAKNILKAHGFNKEEIEDIALAFSEKSFNGGTHAVNYDENRSFIVLGLYSSIPDKIQTICHECYHAVDAIANQCRLDCKESVAYLFGLVMKKLIPLLSDKNDSKIINNL